MLVMQYFGEHQFNDKLIHLGKQILFKIWNGMLFGLQIPRMTIYTGMNKIIAIGCM